MMPSDSEHRLIGIVLVNNLTQPFKLERGSLKTSCHKSLKPRNGEEFADCPNLKFRLCDQGGIEMSFVQRMTAWMTGKSERRLGIVNRSRPAGCIETFESRTVLSTTSLFSAGTLTITSNGADNMAVSKNANGNVTLNGTQLMINNAAVTASSVTTLDVIGGKGKNTIDLTGVTSAAFTGLTTVKIDGGAGNDSIIGSGLNDSILGNGGNDTINGGAGNDTLNGGAGNDNINGDAGNDVLIGGTGNDILNGGAGNDSLSGGAGKDSLDGGAGLDSINGGAGADTITKGTDNDVIVHDSHDVLV
jgi:Ca2+-binding RTX toxin-like protein